MEYPGFYLVNCYTPNSQDGLKRLDYRMEWEDDLRDYLMSPGPAQAGGLLWGPERGPPGDRPEKPKDQPEQRRLHRPGAGKDDLPALLRLYRQLPLSLPGHGGDLAPGWSYRFNARKNNAGWRIDYFLVSDALVPRIQAASIYNEVFGSDHCPIGLELDVG